MSKLGALVHKSFLVPEKVSIIIILNNNVGNFFCTLVTVSVCISVFYCAILKLCNDQHYGLFGSNNWKNKKLCKQTILSFETTDTNMKTWLSICVHLNIQDKMTERLCSVSVICSFPYVLTKTIGT